MAAKKRQKQEAAQQTPPEVNTETPPPAETPAQPVLTLPTAGNEVLAGLNAIEAVVRGLNETLKALKIDAAPPDLSGFVPRSEFEALHAELDALRAQMATKEAVTGALNRNARSVLETVDPEKLEWVDDGVSDYFPDGTAPAATPSEAEALAQAIAEATAVTAEGSAKN